MPVITRSQKRALSETIKTTDTRWYLENLTHRWCDIVKCLNHGSGKTAEVALFRKNGVVYRIAFTFIFKYEYSNGIEADIPEMFDVYKTDGTDITEEEKTYIIKMIKRHYNKTTNCFDV